MGLLDLTYGQKPKGRGLLAREEERLSRIDKTPKKDITPRGILEAVSMIPAGPGDVAAGALAVDDFRNGDYLSGALNGVGVLPFIPALGAALAATKIGSKATGGPIRNRLAAALPGQRGVTAWHGSPHKFDKFDLGKIGTGEGAQAYGHGAYLAESPEVAKSYQALHGAAELRKNGNRIAMYGGENKGVLDELARHGGNFDKAIAEQERLAKDYNGMFAGNANRIKKTLEEWKSEGYEAVPLGQLYKTDIPEEAVSRFLDWDKPLSQQAPEVQAAFLKAQNLDADPLVSELLDMSPAGLQIQGMVPTAKGSAAYKTMALTVGDAMASDKLRQAGIPGIRYLDQGSRNAGAGTSNFVIFDPEMIRILERNGVPTGAQPWAPGEWGLLSP